MQYIGDRKIGINDDAPLGSNNVVEEARRMAEAFRAKYEAENIVDTNDTTVDEESSRIMNLSKAVASRAGSVGAEIVDGIVDGAVSLTGYVMDKSRSEVIASLPKDGEGFFFDQGDFDKNSTTYTAFDEFKNGGLDEFYGYDNTKTSKASSDISKALDEGGLTDVVMSIADNVDAAPELIAESLATMGALLNPVGMTASFNGYMNRNLDERRINQDNKEVDAKDYAIAGTTAAFELLAGKMALNKVFGLKGAFSKVVKSDKIAAKKVLSKLAGRIIGVGGAIAAEGAEEAFQELMQEAGAKYGTKFQEDILSRDNMIKYGTAGALGGIAGGGIKATTNTLGAVKDIAQGNKAEKIKGVVADKVKIQELRQRLSDTKEGTDERAKVEEEIRSFAETSQNKAYMDQETFDAYTSIEEQINTLQSEGVAIASKITDSSTAEEVASAETRLQEISDEKKSLSKVLKDFDKEASVQKRIYELPEENRSAVKEAVYKTREVEDDLSKRMEGMSQEEQAIFMEENKQEFDDLIARKKIINNMFDTPLYEDTVSNYVSPKDKELKEVEAAREEIDAKEGKVGEEVTTEVDDSKFDSEEKAEIDILREKSTKGMLSIDELKRYSELVDIGTRKQSPSDIPFDVPTGNTTEDTTTQDTMNTTEDKTTSHPVDEAISELETTDRLDSDGNKINATFKRRVYQVNEIAKDAREKIGRFFMSDGTANPKIKSKLTKSTVQYASPKGKLRNVISKMEGYLSSLNYKPTGFDKTTHSGRYITNKDGKIPSSIAEVIPTAILSTYANLQANFPDGINIDRLYNDVGEAILRATGIDIEFDGQAKRKRESMALSVGIAAVDSMIEEGYFKTEMNEIVDETINKKMKVLQVATNESLAAIGTSLGSLARDMGVTVSTRPTFYNEDKSKPGVFNGISTLLKKAINNASQTKYRINPKVAKIFKEKSRKEMLLMAGWKDPSEVNINLREERKRKNIGIERNYDDAIQFIEEAGKKSFTYDYAMQQNMRLRITNTFFNPQSDKQFARPLLSIGESVDITVDNEVTFFRAVLLAVHGVKIERMSDSDIISAMAEYKEPESYNGSEGIQAYYANQEYQEYLKAPVGFSTDLHIEVDGVTNGFFFSLMNFPTSGMIEKFGNAVGIFRKGDKHQDLPSYFKDGGKDIYEFSAVNMRGTAKSMMKEDGTHSYIFNKTYATLFGENGILKSRDVMKDPTMRYFYGTGLNGIKSITGELVLEQLLSLVVDNSSKSQLAMESLIILANPKLPLSKARAFIVENMSKNPNFMVNFKFSNEQISKIKSSIEDSYGIAVYNSVHSNFYMMRAEVDTLANSTEKIADIFNEILLDNKLDQTLRTLYGKDSIKKKDLLEPKLKSIGGGFISMFKNKDRILKENGTLGNFYNPDRKTPRRVPVKGSSKEFSHYSPIVRLNQSQDAWTIGNNQATSNAMLSMFDAIITNLDEIATEQEKYNTNAVSQIGKYSHYKAVMELYSDAKSKVKILDEMILDAKSKHVSPDKLIEARNDIVLGLSKLGKEHSVLEENDKYAQEERLKIKDSKINQVAGVEIDSDAQSINVPYGREHVIAGEVDKDALVEELLKDKPKTAKMSIALVESLAKVLKGDTKIFVGSQDGKSSFSFDDGYRFIIDPMGSISDIAHEMIHAITSTAFKDVSFRDKHSEIIGKVQRFAESYVMKDDNSDFEHNIRYLKSIISNTYDIKRTPAEIQERVAAEMVAIFGSNAKMRNRLFAEMKTTPNDKTLFKRLVDAIAKLTADMSNMLRVMVAEDSKASKETKEYTEFYSMFVDAMNRTARVSPYSGSYDVPTRTQIELELGVDSKGVSFIVDGLSSTLNAIDENLNRRMYSIITSNSTTQKSKRFLLKQYKNLIDRFPMVEKIESTLKNSEAVLGVLNNFHALGQVSYDSVHKLLGQAKSAEEKATTHFNIMKQEIDDVVKGMSDKDKSLLTDGLLRADLGIWFEDNESAVEIRAVLNGAVDIDDKIELMYKKLNIDEAREYVDAMVKGMIHQKFSEKYSTNVIVLNERRQWGLTNKELSDLDMLVSLAALKESGAKDIIAKMKTEDIATLMTMAGGFRAKQFQNFEGKEWKIMKGFVATEYDYPMEVAFVERKDMDKYEADGWKKTGHKVGNITTYTRKDLTGRYYSGVIAPMSEQVKGLELPDLPYDELVAEYGEGVSPIFAMDKKRGLYIRGYRLMMSKDDKIKYLGMHNSIDKTLASTVSKALRYNLSKIVAQKAIEELSYDMAIPRDVKKLEDKRKRGDDLPVFISSEILSLQDMPEELAKLYVPISDDVRLSSEFTKSGIRFVRKGMSDAMLGYSEKFFTKKREMRRLEIWWKGFIAESKVNIAVKNATVIKGNFISNMFILSSMGVNLTGKDSGIKYSREYFKAKNEYLKLKEDEIKYEMAMEGTKGARHKAYKSKLTKVRNELKLNPLNEAEEYGIMQSLTNAVLSEDSRSSDVFRDDIDRILEPLRSINVSGSKEVKDTVNKLIKVSGLPKSWKDYLTFENNKDTDMKSLLQTIYLHEGTAVGKVTVSLTQDADQMSRWVLFRHIQKELVAKAKRLGKEPDMEDINHQASVIASQSFVDYREQLPEELRSLSTYGIWRFVMFGTRINQALLRMVYTKPSRTIMNSIYMSTIADLLGETRSSNPFNSNLFTGMEFGTTLDPTGSEMFLPMYY